METTKKKIGFVLRLLQGALIGVGGVLPGVSGGVLCVAFGLYKPLMEVLASPLQKLKLHWKTLLPVGIGAAAGFFLLVRLVSALLQNYEALATCVFAGLILGTLPSLIRTAGRERRTVGSYISFFVSFLCFFALFAFLEHGVGVQITPSFLWFLLAGAIWGISIVLPGLSSSAILIFLGLFEPLVAGAEQFDLSVLLPLAIGGVGAIVLLSKVVNMLLERHFSVMSHIIIGIVLATTLPILPMHFTDVGDLLVQIALVILGFVAAMLFDYMGSRIQ